LSRCALDFSFAGTRAFRRLRLRAGTGEQADRSPSATGRVAEQFGAGQKVRRQIILFRRPGGDQNLHRQQEFLLEEIFRGRCAAYSTGATVIPHASTRFATKGSCTVRAAPEGGKVVSVRDYPDIRPFLAKGTRQEALSQQDNPLTMEEVRELLNKSK
jgi:hypothetical protein